LSFCCHCFQGHVAPKPLPAFKGFVIEEEEGSGKNPLYFFQNYHLGFSFLNADQEVMFIVSGGYGTVYRAQRTKDGKTFAIKCMNTKPPIFMYSFLLFFLKLL